MRRLALLIAVAASAPAASDPGDCLPDQPGIAVVEARHPMEFTLRQVERATVLQARGEIDPGAADRLEHLVADARLDEVWFDSPGGDIREALRIGRLLRDRRAFTRVPAGATCTGACAEAFLGGVGRVVDAGGRLGFTAVPLSDPASGQSQAEREQAAARWAEERADYYIRAGISRGLLRLQLDTPAPGICYLSEAGMRRYNVINLGASGG